MSFVSIDPTSLYMMSYIFGYFTQFNPMWVVFAYSHLWEEAPVIESVSTEIGSNGIATLEKAMDRRRAGLSSYDKNF